MERTVTTESIHGGVQLPLRNLDRNHDPTRRLSRWVVRDFQEFDGLKPEWDELVRTSSAFVFQSHDWNRLWWEHYAGSNRHALHIVLFHKDEQLVGICPFVSTTHTALGLALFRQLRLIGCGIQGPIVSGLKTAYGPTDYLDAIVHPEYREIVAESLIEYLNECRQDFDEVQLSNVPEGSILRDLGSSNRLGPGWHAKAEAIDVCPQLRIPNSVESYLRGLKQKVRRRFTQAHRATGKLYSISTVRSLPELERCFRELMDLHQRHWNELGYPGLFADPRFERFQADVARRFFENGWLWFKTARTDGGDCVAAHIAFVFNDCFYVYVSGFDKHSPVANRRPGIALILSMIEDAIQSKISIMDFLRGDEPYKLEFTSDVRIEWTITMRNARTQHTPRALLYRIVSGIRVALLLAFNEQRLYRVQRSRHGFPHCVASYVDFRLERVKERLRRGAGGVGVGQTNDDSAATANGDPDEGNSE